MLRLKVLSEQMDALIAFKIKAEKLEGVIYASIQFEPKEQKHESKLIFKLVVGYCFPCFYFSVV